MCVFKPNCTALASSSSSRRRHNQRPTSRGKHTHVDGAGSVVCALLVACVCVHIAEQGLITRPSSSFSRKDKSSREREDASLPGKITVWFLLELAARILRNGLLGCRCRPSSSQSIGGERDLHHQSVTTSARLSLPPNVINSPGTSIVEELAQQSGESRRPAPARADSISGQRRYPSARFGFRLCPDQSASPTNS